MPYFVVKDFARGLDARRMLETTEVGALIEGLNCHITRGGEAEKRKAFVLNRTLPVGTHGLWVDDDGSITVFGSEVAPAGLPAGTSYLRCQHPDGVTRMHRVLSQDSFFGEPYIVAEYVDGTTHHFYNGERISDTGVPADFEPPDLEPEDPEAEPPPPQYPVGNGRATASVRFYFVQGTLGQITSCTVSERWYNNALEAAFSKYLFDNLADAELPNTICDPSVFPISVSASDVAAAVKVLADAINAYQSTPNCHARANGNELIVSMADYGSEFNGYILRVGTSNSVEKDPTAWSTFSGGVDVPPPDIPDDVEDPPTQEPAEEFRWSPGRFAITHRQKVYATSANLLYHSAIDNCKLYIPDATGAGFIDVSTHAKGVQDLVSLGEYQGSLAVFSPKQVQIWIMDPDPRRNQLSQVLQSTGTLAPRSVTEYGTGDVFYLDKSGIRSLSSRAVSNTAYMSDVGSLIDTLVTQKIIDIGPLAASRSIGLVEPEHGRLWMIVKDVIYVLSFFPTSKISAWTMYEPGFTIDYADTNATHVYVRSGDRIYVYGGIDESTYGADYDVVVQVPFLDFQRPGTVKKLKGMDAALVGTWDVRAALDATRPNALAKVGELTQSTYSYLKVPLYGAATHVSMRFKNRAPGPARIGAIAIHYNESEAG